MLVAEYSTAVAPPETAQVSYLTTDHLGSPRVITDKNGVVIDRKDYSAFGEESVSAQRSANGEYSSADQLRKNYTGYEKDSESGLEYAQARYYNPTHGRFTSVDPMNASASTADPQTFNRYAYVSNDPLNLVDPTGLEAIDTTDSGGCSAEYSYSQCGGDKGFWGGGDFGDQVAVDSRYHDDVSLRSNSYDLYLERVTNAENGYGFQTSTQVEAAVASFWIWYYYRTDGSLYTNFSLDLSPTRGSSRGSSGGLNDNGRALIGEMGRWGPVLQKTTNTMGGAALAIIAAPVVVDAGITVVTNLAERQLVNTLANMTRGEIQRTYLKGGKNILLDAFFKNGNVLPGLSREMVLAYMEIARKAIADGHNTTGAQAIRLQQLEELIKTLK